MGYDIRYTYCIGFKEMYENLRHKIIFKSRQMVSYSNSFKPCQNYLILQNNLNTVYFITTYIATLSYLHTNKLNNFYTAGVKYTLVLE